MFGKILLSTILATSALAAPFDALEAEIANLTANPRPMSWRAGVGTKWQIILSSTLSPYGINTPYDAQVWDVDLFNTPASTIQALKAQGKTVMCYFSAGTYEPSRPDLGYLGAGDVGAGLPDWPGERWLNLRSATVLRIMQGRIQQAAQKGCDAVDPDNIGESLDRVMVQR